MARRIRCCPIARLEEREMKRNLALVFFLLLVVPGLYAQRTIASLSGTVTDPTGAVVPNAIVTAINVSTSIAARTQTIQKGKTFFFFSYQGLRERVAANGIFASTP